MKNINRLAVVRSTETGRTETSFVLTVKGLELTARHVSGRHPTTGEFNVAVAKLLSEYIEEYGPLERFQRKNRYRFVFRTGMSGCQDTYIEYDQAGDGFVTRRHICHMSMYGKTDPDSFRCFVFDFLDMCVTGGFLTLENNCYAVPEGACELEKEVMITLVKPRLTEYEEGWTEPGDIPQEVVPLRVCREIPEISEN